MQNNEDPTKENNENSENNEVTEIIIPDHVKHLMDIDRTPEQERELEEALFGPCTMKFEDQFKYHSFLSISQTRSQPHKEWVGETKNDEIVVVKYQAGSLYIGTGRSEMKARSNVLLVGGTKNRDGEIRVQKDLTLKQINEDLKLEWVFPVGFMEE